MDLSLPPTTKAIIDGVLCNAASGEVIPVISPIDGKPFTEVPLCGREDLDRAVAGARAAFEDRRWAGTPPKERKRIMSKWADLVEAEKENLARLQSRDMGMPLGMAMNLEIPNAIDTLRWYAETCDKLYDEMISLSDTVLAQIHRVPLGVVGIILPWNAPAMIGAWKLGPSLAMGNSVVMKPSEEAMLVCLRIAELAHEAGLPPGVLQVVPGPGDTIGDAMSGHMDIDAITFTGSGAVGSQIMVRAAQSNLKRVSLELGGKSANIVMADTTDLGFAADAQVGRMFSNQGQVCEAPSRMLVQNAIMDEFLAEVKTRAAGLCIGNPLDTKNQMGPIVTERQRQNVLGHIARADQDAAEIILDGRKAEVPSEGFYLGPTIARVAHSNTRLAQDEVFGPVLTVLGFDTVDEAVEIANATRYGLAAGLWSSNIETIQTVTRRLLAGNINVNGGAGPAVELPFGGFKESGFGRDRSLHALDKYSDFKNVILRSSA